MRARATQVQMQERREAIIQVIQSRAPLSVRHVFYAVTGMGLVPKTRGGYQKVQREVLRLRREGAVSYSAIVDGTRFVRRSQVFDDLDHALRALRETSRIYRRNLWSDSAFDIEVWCESDSIAGTIWPVVDEWAMPLYVTRGYASETFLYNSASSWGSYVVVLYVGDYDPHGRLIEDVARERLGEFSGAVVEWKRIAVTSGQVQEYNLQTSYGGHGVEAEAMDPDTLRELLEDAILEYADEDEVAVLREAEASERQILRQILETATGGAA
jgi:hypothetical protein